MTLEQAIEALNSAEHRGRSDWAIFMSRSASPASAPSVCLFEFEAVAVAEAYLKADREKAGAHLRRPLD